MPLPRIVRRAQQGYVAALLGGVGLMLLAAIGVGIYTGIVAYVQGELHEIALSTAGTAARSVYDDVDATTQAPVLSPAKAVTAGWETFNNMVAANTILTAFNPGLDLHPLGDEVYEAIVLAEVNVPLLAIVGLDNMLIEARASAIYAQNDLSTIVQDIHSQGGAQFVNVPLDLPVLNGSGPDIYISTLASSTPKGYHGVMVELCVNNGDCYDVGDGAYPTDATKGLIVERNGRNVLYGEFFIDLENVGINKGTTIRIVDDLVNDRYLAADLNTANRKRILELVPHMVDLLELRTFHHAFMCFENNCSYPTTRFVAGSTPYVDSNPP